MKHSKLGFYSLIFEQSYAEDLGLQAETPLLIDVNNPHPFIKRLKSFLTKDKNGMYEFKKDKLFQCEFINSDNTGCYIDIYSNTNGISFRSDDGVLLTISIDNSSQKFSITYFIY